MKEPITAPAGNGHEGARERALDALAISRREGVSLSAAARRVRTDRRTVLRHAGRGFKKEKRRWQPRLFDRIPRELTVLTATGPETVVVRDSRTASLLAEHANAVRRYRDLGDDTALRAMRRPALQLNRRPIVLLTDLSSIDRLAEGGELHYELYAR